MGAGGRKGWDVMEQEGRGDNRGGGSVVVCPQLYCTRPSSGEIVCESWPLRCRFSVLFLLSESSRSPASLSRSRFLSLRPSWLSLSLRLLRFLLSFRSDFLRVPENRGNLTRKTISVVQLSSLLVILKLFVDRNFIRIKVIVSVHKFGLIKK